MNHIYVLGQAYELVTSNEEEDLRLINNNAICERYAKEIIINTSQVPPMSRAKNDELSKNITITHEVIHCFFHESGLTSYCEDELLVQYLAVQLEKMYVASQKACEIYNQMCEIRKKGADESCL